MTRSMLVTGSPNSPRSPRRRRLPVPPRGQPHVLAGIDAVRHQSSSSCSERFMLVLRDGVARTRDRVPGRGLQLISAFLGEPDIDGTSPSASVLPNRGEGVHGACQPWVPSLTRPWLLPHPSTGVRRARRSVVGSTTTSWASAIFQRGKQRKSRGRPPGTKSGRTSLKPASAHRVAAACRS